MGYIIKIVLVLIFVAVGENLRAQSDNAFDRLKGLSIDDIRKKRDKKGK